MYIQPSEHIQQYGNVEAIDISAKAIEIVKANGINECRVADILKYKTAKKYDTITLFENNIGLGGASSKTKGLFRILTRLLKRNGQIIAIIRHTDFRKKHYSSKYKPLWKGKTAKKFRWFYFNIKFLPEFCDKYNLDVEILDEAEDDGRKLYLIRLFNRNR